MSVVDRLWNLLIWIDQGVNVLVGSGFADETLSALAHRRGGFLRHFINMLFFWQEDHCFQSYLSELQRRQLPPEYRS